jgi:hypothetical protein
VFEQTDEQTLVTRAACGEVDNGLQEYLESMVVGAAPAAKDDGKGGVVLTPLPGPHRDDFVENHTDTSPCCSPSQCCLRSC